MECELFRQKWELLHRDLKAAKADAETLAGMLYSKAMVGKGVRDEVCDPACTPNRAASRLLSAVESRIESYPRDMGTFVDLLSTFAPWQEHAEEMKKKIVEMESRLTLAQPVSESSGSQSPHTHQQPVNIHLIISSSGVAAVQAASGASGGSVQATASPVHEQTQENELFQFTRGPPVHRKHRQSSHSEMPNKPFTQTTSPFSNTSRNFYDHPLQHSSTSLSAIPEEVTDQSSPDDGPAMLCSQTSSLSSQSSTSSTIEEDVFSMKGSLEGIIVKYRHLEHKLRSKDRMMKGLEDELATTKKTYETGMATANEAHRELQGQMMSLQLENKQLREEMEVTRESVVASNLRKQHLLDQLQSCHTEAKQYRDLCAELEVKVQEANQGINFYAEYQKAEAKRKEHEETIERYKRTVADLQEKIGLLETEIEILVSVESSITSVTAALTLDPEREDTSSSLDSL
jgi:hypothetical protein